MKQRIRNLFSSSKIAFKSWWEKDPFRQSAVIAYYAIFSLPGLLVVIIAIAGYFFNKENVSDQIIGQIRSTLGANTAQQVEEIISATSDLGGSVWAVIIGVGTILFGATTVFAQFQKS